MSRPVTLQEMLEAREERVRRQQQLLSTYRTPLLCFTMNIAGPVKTTPLIERGFEAGLDALDQALPAPLFRETVHAPTGSTAYFAVDLPAEQLKDLCLKIEEAAPVGRLFDMDVLTPDGKKLERTTLRGCLVCGAPGRDCAARRLHSVEELQKATNQLLTAHFARTDAVRYANLAVESLLREVYTTPKPGLVDRRNCGSHRDMDLPLFEESAEALRPYFEDCFNLGVTTAGQPPEDTFFLLRQAGITAEKRMFEATHGVNTHKGALFTMGLLLGALGRLWTADGSAPAPEKLCREAGHLYAHQLEKDLSLAPTTAGLKLYQSHGIPGIRGEAAKGFPTLWFHALPTYRDYLSLGLSENDAGACTLLELIARVEDTNLYHRGGPEGAAWAKQQAEALLNGNPLPSLAEIEKLDDAFIRKNLSPGGSADLLAATYFLYQLNKKR